MVAVSDIGKKTAWTASTFNSNFLKMLLHEKEMLITAAGHAGRAIWVKMMKMVACVAFNRHEELNMLSNTGEFCLRIFRSKKM